MATEEHERDSASEYEYEESSSDEELSLDSLLAKKAEDLSNVQVQAPEEKIPSHSSINKTNETEKARIRRENSLAFLSLFRTDIGDSERNDIWNKLKESLQWHGGTDTSMNVDHYTNIARRELTTVKEIFNVSYLTSFFKFL